MNKLLTALILSASLAGCTTAPVQSTPPPKEALVAVANQAPEPPTIQVPVWETSTLKVQDKGNYAKIGKAYVVEDCQKDFYIWELQTALDAYRHTTPKVATATPAKGLQDCKN